MTKTTRQIEQAQTEREQALATLADAKAKLEAAKSQLADAEKNMAELVDGGAAGVTQAAYTSAAHKVEFLQSSIVGLERQLANAATNAQSAAAKLAACEVADSTGDLSGANIAKAEIELTQAVSAYANACQQYNSAHHLHRSRLREARAIAGEVSPLYPAYLIPRSGVNQPERLIVNGHDLQRHDVGTEVQAIVTKTLNDSANN